MLKVLATIKTRWKAKMPQFFKVILGIGTGMAAIALAIQMALEQAHANIPEWWSALYPYLIGMGAGMAAAAKFTRQY